MRVYWVILFNATFHNISVIQWRSVLLVGETRVPGENHRPVVNKGNNKITEHRAIFQQTDKTSQQPENWENRNGPDVVQEFPKSLTN